MTEQKKRPIDTQGSVVLIFGFIVDESGSGGGFEYVLSRKK